MAEIQLTTLKTLVIPAGETGVLKKGVKIISVASDGEVDVTSTCTDLDDVLSDREPYLCYEFAWEEGFRGDGSESHEQGTQICLSIQIGTTTYDINKSTEDEDFAAFVTSIIPSALMAVGSYVRSEDNNKTNCNFCFKGLPSLLATTRIVIQNGRLNDDDQTAPEFSVFARTAEGDCDCEDAEI